MRGKKAQLSGLALYWSVFILITGLFVVFVRFMPAFYFASAINTYDLENKIYAERIFAQSGMIDEFTLRKNYGVYSHEFINGRQFSNAFSKDFEKKLAFRLDINNDVVFFNKDFYDYARPLAPVRYKIFRSRKPVILDGLAANFTVEQVFTNTLKTENE